MGQKSTLSFSAIMGRLRSIIDKGPRRACVTVSDSVTTAVTLADSARATVTLYDAKCEAG